jgi:2-dehydropantoate 2-reductase
MKICVYGAGAIGGLMAAWLARSGHDVAVVARGAQLEAIRRDGLRVRSKGKTESFRVKAESEPARLGAQDYVLVTVKAQSLTSVAETIAPLLGKDTSVVTAMNGVPWWFFHRLKFRSGDERLESLDPGGTLSRAIPTERVVGCVIHLAASTPEPGLVSHNMDSKLILGEPGGENTARTKRIADALAAAGFEIVVTDSIEKEFWVKLLGNVSFNPVSALTVTTADQLIQNEEVKAYMVEIMREVLAIGRAVGVDANIDPEARIDMARVLGPFKTSMLQDLEAAQSWGARAFHRKPVRPDPGPGSIYGAVLAWPE